MSSHPPVPNPPGAPITAISRKVFPQGSPIPPAYTNAVEFTGMGMDVIMDIGIVSPEAVQQSLEKAPKKSGMPTVDFVVNARFGMSIQTAAIMHHRLGEFLQRATAQVAQMNALLTSTPMESEQTALPAPRKGK